ncbi:MAG: hybrid sensor histidine kinase/response regulator [Zetaproteobacteria bacterium]|nr:hybrid sensor histidine kinase/response regulator [Zetaproteobacteria bacterium]
MIEDQELRALFKIESEEHLQNLDRGVLQLEKTPDDIALVEEMFREIHSLKGAARMLGLMEIMERAHEIESLMGVAKGGESPLTMKVLEDVYQRLSTVRMLVAAEVDGSAIAHVADTQEGSPLAVATVVNKEGLADEPTQRVSPPPTVAAFDLESSAVRSSNISPDVEIPEAIDPDNIDIEKPFIIDTVRVQTEKLDRLMTQVGELTVTRGSVERRLAELDALLDLSDLLLREAQLGQYSFEKMAEMYDAVAQLRSGAYTDSSRINYITDELVEGVQSVRLLPLSTLFNLFLRPVHDLAQEMGKRIELIIEGGDAFADKQTLEALKDPLMHLLRNAIDHGIEMAEERKTKGKNINATLQLRALRTNRDVVIEVYDDGRGLDLDRIRHCAQNAKLKSKHELALMRDDELRDLIFVSGFSTSHFITDVSGRGVGLDVVSTNVKRLKGTVHVESSPDQGTKFSLRIPVTMSTVRVLIVAVSGYVYAFPVTSVRASHRMHRNEIYTLEGRATILLNDEEISILNLADILEVHAKKVVDQSDMGGEDQDNDHFIVVLLEVDENVFAVVVDQLLDEQQVMIKPFCSLLKRVRNVSGAMILETGEICVLLNPGDLLATLRKTRESQFDQSKKHVSETVKKVILLAEDSLVTRTQERRILEAAGYEVVTAVDGLDARNKLATRHIDAIVSDINMPNMDGFALMKSVRLEKKYANLPIVLVTMLASDADKRRGLEGGANAYITKTSFDQKVLVDALRRLV